MSGLEGSSTKYDIPCALSFIASLLMLSTNNSELTLDIVVSVLLLTVFASLGYILYETKRHHLTEIDVEAK